MLKELTIPQLKKRLAAMDRKEAEELFLVLYKSSKTAKQIVNMQLLGDEYIQQVLDSYKEKLFKMFFPSNLTTAFSLSAARQVVKEFSSICTDEQAVADLTLYDVECMLEFTNTFGDINGRFYDSMCRMYHAVIGQILKNPELLDSLDKRLKKCIDNASGFGWGVEEYMRHEYRQMRKACSAEYQK